VADETPWEITATSWPEICEITDKRSQTVMDAFHNTTKKTKNKKTIIIL
jgi:hypothetical protein